MCYREGRVLRQSEGQKIVHLRHILSGRLPPVVDVTVACPPRCFSSAQFHPLCIPLTLSNGRIHLYQANKVAPALLDPCRVNAPHAGERSSAAALTAAAGRACLQRAKQHDARPSDSCCVPCSLPAPLSPNRRGVRLCKDLSPPRWRSLAKQPAACDHRCATDAASAARRRQARGESERERVVGRVLLLAQRLAISSSSSSRSSSSSSRSKALSLRQSVSKQQQHQHRAMQQRRQAATPSR